MKLASFVNPENLSKSKSWKDVESSHQMVVRFHAPAKEEAVKNLDAVDGKHYTQEELDYYKETRRVPIVMNQFPASRRTVVGTFLRERFDVEFVPVDADDQALADALRALAAHEDYQGKDVSQDAILAVNAWIMGSSYRYVWPETYPGETPFINNRVLNSLAVSWDPNSTELITRSDANFVDVDLWMAGEEILEKWPKAKLNPDASSGNSEYAAVDPSRDRDHETLSERNGKWHVVERYYRVREMQNCILDDNDEWIVVKDPEKYLSFFPDAKIIRRRCESLYVAIWSCGACASDEFLYNGPYHVQPRDSKTRKILWPVLEMVAEQVGGVAKSFVSPLRDANKVIDVMVTGIIESAKHAPSSYEVDETAYLNPEEAKRAMQLGPHSNQRFKMKPGMAGKGMLPTQKAVSTGDFDKGVNIASQFIDQQSSTPPASKGWTEGSSSGVLNQQRIEQGNIQLAEFIHNYRSYRAALNNLRYAYWREVYTDEMVVRITGSNGKPEVYELNKEVPAVDSFGNRIPGKTSIINDINSALYDVRIADSYKSPTVRDRQLQVLGTLMQNQVVMQDPLIAGALINEFARITDSSAELKENISKAVARKAEAAQKQESLDQMEQVANMQSSPNGIPSGINGLPAPTQPETAGIEPSTQSLESVQ